MRSFVAFVVFVVFVAGCGVKGSCDRRANAFECEEITASTIKDMAENKCTSAPNTQDRGVWAEKKACDRTGAIGGCEGNLSRTWYYPGGRVTKLAHVRQLCSSSSKVLGPDGKEVTGVVAEKLPDGPAGPDPGLEAIISSMRGPLEANVAAIAKLRVPPGAATGTVKLTGGKHVLASKEVAAVYDDDLPRFVDLKLPYRKDYPLDGDDLRTCGAAVRAKNRQFKSDADLAAILKWCSQLTTLLVVKTTKLEKPVDKNDLTNFHGGLVEGIVTVFELPSGKVAGSYAFKAESSEKVKANELEDDLRKSFGKALGAALAKADPGATYTFEVGESRQ
ncbi:MAG: hypothetical protein KIT84_14390 [Labilithrix sp.]|nr:hypothetical protein [Labilithrix sp.]MCW5812210.1 hypothetical protein [Labilithrix sp.]